MALKRATKSIPLSGGIVEEVDDFLLEPSGMQYMENVRYTKKDVAEKAEPVSFVQATGAANYTVDAYGLWTRGDRVAVLGNNEIATSDDAGATFEIINPPTDLLGIEKILSTAEQSGGINFTWAPLGDFEPSPRAWPVTHYAVAFERMEIDSRTGTTSREVVGQIYASDGQLISESVYSNGCTPRVTVNDSFASLHFVDTTNGDILWKSASLSTLAWQTGATYARDVRNYSQLYNNTNKGYGAVGAELSGEDMRLGYADDVRFGNGAIAVWQDFEGPPSGGGDAGVIAWKTDTTATIEFQMLLNGGLTGSSFAVINDVHPFYLSLLDVTADDTYVYVLYSRTRTTLSANQTQVFITRMTHLGAGATTYTVASNLDGAVVNGSIRVNASNMFVAFTEAWGDPTTGPMTSLGNHKTWWQKADQAWPTPASVANGELYSHRLCSNVALDRTPDLHFCVQQWDNWNPDKGAIGGSPDIPALAPVHQKPVTTLLIKIDTSTLDPEVIASFDAGQSKAMPPSLEEQNIHTNNLYYFDQGVATAGAHQFWYGNRNILTAEDSWYFITNATGNPWPGNDARIPLAAGSARMNVYRLQSSIRVPFVNFPNGMFVGTSVPVWYDGSRTLSSITALDSPEIVSVDMDGDGASFMAYQDVFGGATGEEPKVIQAVWGYYDDAGLVHRGAPSFPVYVGNAKALSTTAFWIEARVTPPLTVAKDRKYFLEMYEAFPGEVPQLCAKKHFASGNASAPQTVSWTTNVNPTTSVKDLDVTGFGSAKALYTAGNVLAADPWPNFDLVVRSGRRLFAHSISDPSAIFYSKTFENGIAPEFSAALVISLGNEVVTALGQIDDKVIAWTQDSTWVIYGTGPDNTGANGDFFVERLPFALGCIDPESVLTYEDGIAFYSNSTREFHTLTRDLQVVDIGENVKDMTGVADFNINRALVYPEAHELRYYCTQTPDSEYGPAPDTGTGIPQRPPRPFFQNQPPLSPVFVFNYKYGKWSVVDDGGQESQIVGLLNGKPCMLKSWNFYKHTEDWTDANLVKQETPWIKVNQLQDFGRFYGLVFVGRYLSSWSDTDKADNLIEAGDIQVTVKYDYEGQGGAIDVHRFRANLEFDPDFGQRLQFTVSPSRQKCQTIKIIIEEVATTKIQVSEPTYTTGRGFILTAVDIEYGAKGGSGDKSIAAGRKK